MKGICLKYTQNNYGSKLQALATVKTLEELGQDYEIIEYNKKTLWFILKSLPRFLNFCFLNDRYDQFQRKIEYKRHPEVLKQINIRQHAFWSFDEPFKSHLSKRYESYSALKKECGQKYDGVLTCSDQLWSPAALGSGFYNLMFAPDDMLKVSWASSFGVSKIPWYQIGRTKKYLKRIEHISMRENQGAKIVKDLIGREVPVLMDPVFIFDKDKWNELIPCAKPKYENYIFCYFLGSNTEHRKIANELAQKTGLKIVTLRHLDRYNAQDENFGDYAPYDVTPQDFLNILRNAEYICTDSFHGTAFSVIFEKKFIAFDRYSDKSSNSKNSRIQSVCENLGLLDRRYVSDSDIVDSIGRDIDYKLVFEKLAVYRENTMKYLKNAFNVK